MSQEYTLKLELNCEPRVAVRVVLPSDDALTRKSKLKKQFINKKTCILTVFAKGKQFTITAHKDYCFDGATIPFGIGKGNTRLQIGALFHDIICENKELVDYDCHLATDIFEKLVVMCGEPKWKASTMHFFINRYQHMFCRGWK